HWDDGDDAFPPTSFQIAGCHSGCGAENVIPGEAEAVFNWRFSPALSVEAIRNTTAQYCRRHGIDPVAIKWRSSGLPFITRKGRLLETAATAVHDHCGHPPRLSTSGGTSDGRYIA